MRGDRWLGILAAGQLLLATGCPGLFAGGVRPPRSLLLISIDTLRADALGSYGSSRDTSPELDRFAAGALRFSAALAPSPWTIPSHASLFTGLDPSVVGADVEHPMSDRALTLAEHLKSQGFATGAVVNTSYLDHKFGFRQGFDEFSHQLEFKDAPKNVDTALAFLTQHRSQRSFFFLHLFDVHGPYLQPAPYDSLFHSSAEADPVIPWLRRIRLHDYLLAKPPVSNLDGLRANYQAGVRRVDAELGRLFRELEQRGLLADVLVVVTSDHGEAFFEQGIWVGHGLFLYEGEVRVPLLVRFPPNAGIAPGIDDTPVSLTDVAPTLLDALGVAPFPQQQGRSLMPLARREASDAEAAVYGVSSNLLSTRYVRTARWKYIEPMRISHDQLFEWHMKPDEDMKGPLRARIPAGPQLYDLAADPGEQRNLVAERPEIAERMQRLVAERSQRSDALRAQLFGDATLAPPDLSPEEKQQLREMGYSHD